MDCEVIVCIIFKSYIGNICIWFFNVFLEMWNKVKVKVFGNCKLFVENFKILKKYMVKFVVVEKEFILFISCKVVEKVNFFIVDNDKLENINSFVDIIDVLDEFFNNFNGDIGVLFGFV